MLHSVARIVAAANRFSCAKKKRLVGAERLGFWADGRLHRGYPERASKRLARDLGAAAQLFPYADFWPSRSAAVAGVVAQFEELVGLLTQATVAD